MRRREKFANIVLAGAITFCLAVLIYEVRKRGTLWKENPGLFFLLRRHVFTQLAFSGV